MKGCISEAIELESGVGEGSVLGPGFFICGTCSVSVVAKRTMKVIFETGFWVECWTLEFACVPELQEAVHTDTASVEMLRELYWMNTENMYKYLLICVMVKCLMTAPIMSGEVLENKNHGLYKLRSQHLRVQWSKITSHGRNLFFYMAVQTFNHYELHRVWFGDEETFKVVVKFKIFKSRSYGNDEMLGAMVTVLGMMHRQLVIAQTEVWQGIPALSKTEQQYWLQNNNNNNSVYFPK